jgi:hypothetical protein
MRRRIAFPRHFVQNDESLASIFAPALDCLRVLGKAGFVFEARLNNIVKDRELLDSLLYTKTG